MRRKPGDALGFLVIEELTWYSVGDPLDDGVERWAVLPAAGENYAVSTLGRVIRITPGPGTRPGRLLRAAPDNHGYVMVQLSFGPRKRRKIRIHRIVAMVFHPRADDDCWYDVHHINHNRTDNRACNVEWQASEEHRLTAWNEYTQYGEKQDGKTWGRGLD